MFYKSPYKQLTRSIYVYFIYAWSADQEKIYIRGEIDLFISSVVVVYQNTIGSYMA